MSDSAPPMDSKSPAWDRWIGGIDAVFNFRDIGGYATAHGQVRTGLVYRADSLAHTSADALAGLGIRTVVDLRSDAEVTTHGGFQPTTDVSYARCPVTHTPWDDQAATAETVQAFLTERYMEIADIGRSGIRDALTLLADNHRRPLVFHCRAGKDRTGVLVALLLSLLGVSDNDVDADYTLSNTAYARYCASRGHDPSEANRDAAAMSSPPRTVSSVLATLRVLHGSIDVYLVNIGVDPEVLDALRDSLIQTYPGDHLRAPGDDDELRTSSSASRDGALVRHEPSRDLRSEGSIVWEGIQRDDHGSGSNAIKRQAFSVALQERRRHFAMLRGNPSPRPIDPFGLHVRRPHLKGLGGEA